MPAARPDLTVAQLAAAQHGVVSVEQLRSAGVTRSTATRWVAAGHLRRLRRGLYAYGHDSLTRDGWWNAAVLVGGAGSGLTAHAACTIWDVLPHGPGPIDLIPGHRVTDPPPWLRVHRTPVAPGELVLRRGLPVTSVARAIVDLAESGSAHEVASALDRALLLRLLDHRQLDDELGRARGRHGLKILLPAVRRLSPHGETFLSQTERRVRDAFLDAGLPRPQMNKKITPPNARPCRADLLWEDERLVVEVDGPQHEMPYQQALDRARDASLRAIGYRVLRFPVDQVDHRFDTVLTRVMAELRRDPPDVIQVAPTPREQPG